MALCARKWPAALLIHADGQLVAKLDVAAGKLAVMHELAALVLLDVIDLKEHAVRLHAAVVRDLPAHLGVEHRAVKHDDGLRTGWDLLAQFAVGNDGDDLRGALGLVIADELRLRDVLAELLSGPAEVAQRLTLRARAAPP